MKEPKILFYDIETTPLAAWIWRLGKQVVRHGQLLEGYDQYGIICISYCWNDGKPAKSINWGFRAQDTAKVIEQFDKVIKQADITIGKNSDKFDVKHINTQRYLANLPPMPEWMEYTDDIEKQIRKHFILPSFGLDYISKIRGLGGKRKMEMQDWVDIVTRKDKKKLTKMVDYCMKDVEDTRALWDDIKYHVKPKFNMSTFLGKLACTKCGSTKLVKNGTRGAGKTMYQKFFCKGHNGHAGRAPLNKDGSFGKIG